MGFWEAKEIQRERGFLKDMGLCPAGSTKLQKGLNYVHYGI
jgi:hypothetical protein